MKKLLLITILFSVVAHAQVVPTKDSLRLLNKRVLSWEILNIGASMPINDFGSKDKSSTSGFAIPGIKMDAAFNIQLYKHLGIKSEVVWQNNQLEKTKFKKDLKNEDPTSSYTVTASGWNNFGIFIGAFGNFDLTKECHLQPYILGGFNLGISPEVNVTVLDADTITSQIKQFKGTATNFSYTGGFLLKFDIARHFQFVTGVSAYYCELKFNGIRIENSRTNAVNNFDILQPVQTLGFKLGVVRTFD